MFVNYYILANPFKSYLQVRRIKRAIYAARSSPCSYYLKRVSYKQDKKNEDFQGRVLFSLTQYYAVNKPFKLLF